MYILIVLILDLTFDFWELKVIVSAFETQQLPNCSTGGLYLRRLCTEEGFQDTRFSISQETLLLQVRQTASQAILEGVWTAYLEVVSPSAWHCLECISVLCPV